MRFIKEAVGLGLRSVGHGGSHASPGLQKVAAADDAADNDAKGPAARAPLERVGKYDSQLVELVAERPGITVAEAAARIGVDATALYPVIKRLQARGQINKRGRELHASATDSRLGQEQLWCEAGHFWQRPTVRGRKPKQCPQHR